MKYTLHSIFCFISFFSITQISVHAQDYNPKQAGSYMTYISQQHREITKDFLSYTSAVGHGKSARKIENRRKELIKTVAEARQKVSSMPAYEGDKTLRDSTANYYLITSHILNEDYGKIVNLEDVAEQSYDAMEAYLLAQDLASEKIEQANDRLQLTEKLFAKDHNVQLVDTKDELSEKAAKAGKITDYHRVVYLIFFKSYKQEMYLSEAIQKKDINAIEQSKNTLLKYSQEGIEKLKATPALFSDNTLESGCRQALQFYIQECTTQIPVMTDFYLKEENFDKIRKAFEAKREKERTKDDVAQYNKAVQDMNKGINDFNSATTQLNNGRKKAIEGWNNASSKFLDVHTPKYR
ncbi:LIC11966 family surface protein [Xanthocytophaga agilis]|uniref:Uncharacterized protein n=1 Tax=Xanthocytophaga agilis TaxID=3048010 RepID=A0AAE3RC74_9BACT|nr:hypothetical protein [Xanthocytophaga agilis]MDJ1504863.1 hypothetical protein [Xanthocytophaga agilis]